MIDLNMKVYKSKIINDFRLVFIYHWIFFDVMNNIEYRNFFISWIFTIDDYLLLGLIKYEFWMYWEDYAIFAILSFDWISLQKLLYRYVIGMRKILEEVKYDIGFCGWTQNMITRRLICSSRRFGWPRFRSIYDWRAI